MKHRIAGVAATLGTALLCAFIRSPALAVPAAAEALVELDKLEIAAHTGTFDANHGPHKGSTNGYVLFLGGNTGATVLAKGRVSVPEEGLYEVFVSMMNDSADDKVYVTLAGQTVSGADLTCARFGFTDLGVVALPKGESDLTMEVRDKAVGHMRLDSLKLLHIFPGDPVAMDRLEIISSTGRVDVHHGPHREAPSEYVLFLGGTTGATATAAGRVEVPEDGKYKVLVSMCNDQPQDKVWVTIGGQTVSGGPQRVGEFAYTTLGVADLRKGSAELRVEVREKPVGHMRLDSLKLVRLPAAPGGK